MVRILIEALLYCFFILNVNCLSFAREETPQVFTHSSVRNLSNLLCRHAPLDILFFLFFKILYKRQVEKAKILLLLYITISS